MGIEEILSGDGIPANPDLQLSLLRQTDNGWHNLDPPEDEQPGDPLSLAGISATASIQQQFLFLAQTHTGYVEDSRGRSTFGIWYGNQPDIDNPAYDSAPWCDMFLANLAYNLLGHAGLRAVGDYALTTAHAAFLHRKGVTSRPDVFPEGAWVFQNWDLNGTGNGNLGRIDHVEIVEKDNRNGTITTVGGNVDNGVRRRTRSKSYAVVIAEWWKILPPVSVPQPRSEDWYMRRHR